MTMQTRISAKGQVVIPKDVRDRLRWAQGQTLDVVETSDGVLLKQQLRSKTLSADEAFEKIRKLVSYDGPTVSIQEMNETITEGWRQSALKSDCAKR